MLAVAWSAVGCKTIAPSNFRNWAPDQAVLPHARFEGDLVHVRNIRNCKYISADDYIVDHYDQTFDLRDIRTVDFIVCPFPELASIAHTMLSFGFEGGDYIALSVEIRKEDGEAYHPLKGFFRQYELMYVLGDERDLIQLCTNHLDNDVYVYRSKATPEQARALFVDVLERANKLVDQPEFYHTISNNCTTNIANHVNKLWPDRVPYGWGVLLPGYADQWAYQLGLFDTDLPFEELRARSKVNYLAHVHAGDREFSARIRQR